jgi:hypothetical protein
MTYKETAVTSPVSFSLRKSTWTCEGRPASREPSALYRTCILPCCKGLMNVSWKCFHSLSTSFPTLPCSRWRSDDWWHTLATYKLAINYEPRQNLSAKKHAFSYLLFILKYLFWGRRLIQNKNTSLSQTFPWILCTEVLTMVSHLLQHSELGIKTLVYLWA